MKRTIRWTFATPRRAVVILASVAAVAAVGYGIAAR